MRAPDAVLTTLALERERFRRFVRRRVVGDAEAEDILQQALARAVERGGELRRPERAVAWFYRLLRNAIVDHRRALRAALLRSCGRCAEEGCLDCGCLEPA